MHWIIGDIHGMLAPLRTLLEAVGRVDTSPRLIFVGDYVNRGSDAKGVIDCLLNVSGADFVRGNHDDVFDQMLSGQSYAENASQGNAAMAFAWFMQHGLAETFTSYGASQKQLRHLLENPTERGLAELRQLVPAAHQRFIHELVPVVTESDFFVAHGKWPVAQRCDHGDIRQQLADNSLLRQWLLWDRFQPWEILQEKAWTAVGYFGHTSVENYQTAENQPLLPIVGNRLVLLDTGAALSQRGRLTAFCHQAGRYLQADYCGQLVPPTD